MQNITKSKKTVLIMYWFGFAALLLLQPQKGLGRELSADRPDSTESPISVDDGRFQIESSVISLTTNDDGGTESETFTIGETNLKYGLSASTDIQLVITPYLHERSKSSGVVSEVEGFGDPIIRFKWNLWGNDAGNTAFGLLPFIKIPTGTDVSNDKWEGGLITPFAWEITERLGLGVQLEFAGAFDETEGHIFQLGHTIVLGASITHAIGVYIEYVGTASEIPYEGFFSTGATYMIHDDFQWDIGLVTGLNDHSDDLTVFYGFTTRY